MFPFGDFSKLITALWLIHFYDCGGKVSSKHTLVALRTYLGTGITCRRISRIPLKPPTYITVPWD